VRELARPRRPQPHHRAAADQLAGAARLRSRRTARTSRLPLGPSLALARRRSERRLRPMAVTRAAGARAAGARAPSQRLRLGAARRPRESSAGGPGRRAGRHKVSPGSDMPLHSTRPARCCWAHFQPAKPARFLGNRKARRHHAANTVTDAGVLVAALARARSPVNRARPDGEHRNFLPQTGEPLAAAPWASAADPVNAASVTVCGVMAATFRLPRILRLPLSESAASSTCRRWCYASGMSLRD